ncbi:pentapeptide repeat-containing protein [Planotetraspora sp. GP83]|uniref:pentapeptide repeat-containing protein n=1 Tax=Planotetraspora sp. GP83 TaxID=3156264 RepID=UPI0035173CB3
MLRIAPLAGAVFFAAALSVAAPATAVQAAAGPCKPGSGPNLRGKDFTHGATLPYDLRCADLTKAKLDEVDLTQKDLTGAILRDASLKEADLTQAHLEYADLRGADLSDADLGQLKAKQADLRGAILIDAEAGQAEFPHADLTEAVLTRAVLTQANLTNATLVDADLTESTLGQIKGRTADFTRAKLKDAKLGQAELQHTVLKNADLSRAELTQADLQGADLTGANVQGASFTQAQDLNLTGTSGRAVNVPDDAINGRPASDKETGEETAEDPGTQYTGTDTLGRDAALRGPSPALILVIVSGLGLSLTLLIWGVTHRRRERFAAAMAVARHTAEEEVTRFGEEIDSLDFEMKVNQVSGPTHEWRAALDAYEAAKQALHIAQTPYELQAAASAVQHGRYALQQVRSRLSNTGASDTGGQR